MFYYVANPTEYLCKTGLFIDGLEITRSCFLWPFQKLYCVSLKPTLYSFDLDAMSSEKLEFELPLSFNIGIKDEPECVMRYLRYFSDQAALTPVVNGIIMGETRVIAASMSIEQIFQDRKTFRDYVSKHIQTELDQFGLQIYNANIKELKDAPGSEYFKYRAAKTMQTTINQSKADVAVASTKGVVGQKERESAQRQENSRIEVHVYNIGGCNQIRNH
jgi:flotillin